MIVVENVFISHDRGLSAGQGQLDFATQVPVSRDFNLYWLWRDHHARMNVQARSNRMSACLHRICIKSKNFRQSNKSVRLTRKISSTITRVGKTICVETNICLPHQIWRFFYLWHWYINILNSESVKNAFTISFGCYEDE